MAVISSTIRREGWVGSGNVIDGDKYSIEHLVESDSINDGPLSVALGAENALPHPIPKAWASYAIGNDINLYVVLKDRDTKLHAYTDTGALWIVTSKWEKPAFDDEDDGTGVHPLNRPIKYRVEWSNYTKIINKEVHGAKRAIRNSAGQPFADPLEQDDQRPVLVAVRNVATLMQVVDLGVKYKNAINTDEFWGAEPFHAKVQGITAGDIQVEEGFTFYTQTIRVEFNEESWHRSLLDQGTVVEVDPPTNPRTYEVLKDHTGMTFGQEVQFNGIGGINKPGDPPVWITPAFRTYPELDFSGLGI